MVATISEKVLASSENARSGCCSSFELESDELDLAILDGLLPVALVVLDKFCVDLDMLVVVVAAFDATFLSFLLFVAGDEAIGDPWTDVESAVDAYSDIYYAYRFDTPSGDLYGYANSLVTAAIEREKPNSARLPGYTDSALPLEVRAVTYPGALGSLVWGSE